MLIDLLQWRVLCVLAFLSFALTPQTASAAERATLRGKVLDPQGAPLSDATVSLEEIPAFTVSDYKGRFRLTRIPEGKYTIRVTHIRFAAIVVQIEVEGETIQPVTLQFTEEVPIPLDETVITATKTPRILQDVPLSVTIITSKQIDTYHAETIATVLDQVPGVSQTTNGFTRSSVSLHGLPEQYVLLLVNGQRQYGRHADAKDLEHIPTDAIERIEVVKGPSSVLYGSDAVAGVINVITQDGLREPTFSLYTSGGSKDTYTLRSEGGGTLFGWQHHLAGSGNRSDFMGEGYGFRNKNFHLSSQKTFQEAHRLQVKLGYFDEQTEDMPATDDFAGGNYLDDEVVDVQVSWSWQPREASRWNAAAGYYDQHRVDARPGGDPREWDRNNFLVEMQNTTHRGQHRLTSGAEMRLDNIEYTLIDDRKNQTLLSLFVQDEWAGSNILTLVAATRLEHHDRWGTVAVPRLGLSLRPSPLTTVRISGGTSFRGPALTDLYEQEYYHPWSGGFWLGGNPDLDPEKSIGGNLDVEFRGAVAAVSGGLFYNRLTDRISQKDTGEEIDGKAVRRLVNSEEAVSWGAEFQVRWMPLPALRTTLGYTYLDTEDKVTGLVFDYSPRHTVDVAVNWEPSGQGLNLGVRGKYLGPRFASAARGRKLDRAYVLDLHAEKQIASGFSVFLAVDNTLSEQLYWESRYFQEGRQYRGGLRYRL